MVESTPHLNVLDDDAESPRSHGGCGACGSGAAGGGARCGNGLEKIYPTTAVRFGYMRYIGEFSHAPELKFSCGAKVVIQTQRGIEIGSQVSLTCSGCDKSVTRDEMREWVKRSGEDTYMFNAGRILREATAADLAEYARIQEGARERRDLARKLSFRHELPIKVVECECLFGGERIIFHFTSAERVDFRAMVKDLAREYRTRIEMRQIGARDEARLLADYETCGREVCCKVFLKTLKPISMRMAKLQKATLDPSQVSGRCGRLKCCLRYEHTGYEELDKRLPKMGKRIQTAHGDGVVINRQVLTQLVQIRTDDDRAVTVVIEDILDGTAKAPSKAPSEVPTNRGPEQAPRKEPAQSESTEPRRRRSGRSRRDRNRGTQESPTRNVQDKQTSGDAEKSRPAPRKKRRRRRGRRGNGPGGGPSNPTPPPA